MRELSPVLMEIKEMESPITNLLEALKLNFFHFVEIQKTVATTSLKQCCNIVINVCQK